MSINLRPERRRLYLEGDTYPVRYRLKALGGHWDPERHAWWVGSAKRAEVERLIAQAVSEATPASAAAAEALGLDPDTPAGIIADRLEEEGRTTEAQAIRCPREDPRSIRLNGKGVFQGRTYYLGATTRDNRRVRLLTLPDEKGNFLDFWADRLDVEVTRTYQPREVRYGRHTRTEFTTLGSIAAFVRRQRDPATRQGQCSECGAWGPSGQPCPSCGGEGSYV